MLIGDSKSARGYEEALTPAKAQEMVDIIAYALSRLPIKIAFNQRKTTRRHGRIDKATHYMILYPLGLNEGTVLHELAHLWKKIVFNHGYNFKTQQEELIKLWYG